MVEEVCASPLYKDSVSNLRYADTVKITFHNAKDCYMASFFFILHFQRVVTLLPQRLMFVCLVFVFALK